MRSAAPSARLTVLIHTGMQTLTVCVSTEREAYDVRQRALDAGAWQVRILGLPEVLNLWEPEAQDDTLPADLLQVADDEPGEATPAEASPAIATTTPTVSV